MRGVVIAVAGVALGCANRNSYICASSDQCVLGGQHGVCEPSSYCSFTDPSCPSGRKYEPNAGAGLAGTCVMVDAPPPPCGGVGQACCAGEGATCGPNAFCASAQCTQCVLDVGMGRHATCAIKYDHTLWCTGENGYGQLGFGIAGKPSATWAQVRDSTGIVVADATRVAGGWEFECALRANGTAWCWGNGYPMAATQIMTTAGPPVSDLVEIGLGDDFACGRTSSGGVMCWGSNGRGQLGDGTTTARQTAAAVLVAPAGAPFADATDLHVGRRQACARKSDQSVWCWGRNDQGQIGDTTTMDRPNPVKVGTASSVATGQDHVCTVHSDGTVWCAGTSWRNRIGNGVSNYDPPAPGNYPTPVQVVSNDGRPFTGATQVAAGGVSCARMADTTAFCWGDDAYGETGTGAGTTTPAQVLATDGKPLHGIDHLVTHGSHVCAFGMLGELWCWGRNLENEFGDGSFANWGVAHPLGFPCP